MKYVSWEAYRRRVLYKKILTLTHTHSQIHTHTHTHTHTLTNTHIHTETHTHGIVCQNVRLEVSFLELSAKVKVLKFLPRGYLFILFLLVP